MAAGHISSTDIIKTLSEYYEVLPEDITGKKKTKSIVIIRNYTAYLMSRLTNMSSTEIGAAIGGRDHSTVIYAVNKVKEQYEKDSDVKEEIEKLVAKIKGEGNA